MFLLFLKKQLSINNSSFSHLKPELNPRKNDIIYFPLSNNVEDYVLFLQKAKALIIWNIGDESIFSEIVFVISNISITSPIKSYRTT